MGITVADGQVIVVMEGSVVVHGIYSVYHAGKSKYDASHEN